MSDKYKQMVGSLAMISPAVDPVRLWQMWEVRTALWPRPGPGLAHLRHHLTPNISVIFSLDTPLLSLLSPPVSMTCWQRRSTTELPSLTWARVSVEQDSGSCDWWLAKSGRGLDHISSTPCLQTTSWARQTDFSFQSDHPLKLQDVFLH